jgi:hypothetical protein
MLRLVITAYLIVVALVGPGLCCCTLAELLQSKVRCHWDASTQAELTKHRHHCCHHHSHAPAKGQPPDDRDQESPRCPCGNRRDIAVALLPSDLPMRSVDGQSLGAVCDYAGIGVLLLATIGLDGVPSSPATSPGAVTGFFGGGREILRALHVLRC